MRRFQKFLFSSKAPAASFLWAGVACLQLLSLWGWPGSLSSRRPSESQSWMVSVVSGLMAFFYMSLYHIPLAFPAGFLGRLWYSSCLPSHEPQPDPVTTCGQTTFTRFNSTWQTWLNKRSKGKESNTLLTRLSIQN